VGLPVAPFFVVTTGDGRLPESELYGLAGDPYGSLARQGKNFDISSSIFRLDFVNPLGVQFSMIFRVVIGKQAGKDLERVQRYVADIFLAWVLDVERRGLEEVRKVVGHHDEPCKGKLKGLRSIRLTKGYRAYYRIEKDQVEFVFVERVDKHVY
jgi:addiction module RelE/StbE family toxin